jgi:hypothetical protein
VFGGRAHGRGLDGLRRLDRVKELLHTPDVIADARHDRSRRPLKILKSSRLPVFLFRFSLRSATTERGESTPLSGHLVVLRAISSAVKILVTQI